MKNWLLLGVVVVLILAALLLNPSADFGGADSKAEEVIAEIQPGVEPWMQPLWEPPSSETESLLFALQAAIGAGIIGYFFGVKRAQNRAQATQDPISTSSPRQAR